MSAYKLAPATIAIIERATGVRYESPEALPSKLDLS